MYAVPRFVYLMSCVGKEKLSYVGYATDPFQRLRSQNRELGTTGGSKGTRSGAPHWRLEMIVGPFFSFGRTFKHTWRRKSRGLDGRVIFGRTWAKKMHRRLWARDPQWVATVSK
jgi:hypothetical protein